MTEIKKNIFFVGALDPNRRLFDALIPLPDGTSYNSYLVVGSEKTALIDTVDLEKTEILLKNLKELDVKKIDFIVANHAEQDHSGSIPKILEVFPQAKILTNEKCKLMLIDLMQILENKFQIISDGEKISLGNKTLKFTLMPWVHWPETMVTYLEEDQILFSCDLFGSHLASEKLFVKDEPKTKIAAKRYYAEIMMPFRPMIQKHLEKLKEFDFCMIAPSHGPIYDNPATIVELYLEWISDKVKNKVVIIYVSMHGSTKTAVDYFVSSLNKQNISVDVFEMSEADLGDVAISLVDSATIVVATPTVLYGPHPAVASAVNLANALKPKAKFASVINSYGWASKVPEQIVGMVPNLKVEVISPVSFKGCPKEDDLKKLDVLASEIAKRHENLN